MNQLFRRLHRNFKAATASISMYDGILVSLIYLLSGGMILALTGTISISAGGLAAVIAVVTAASYLSNKLLARIMNLPSNSQSWLITALIMACILAPTTDPTRLAFAALAAVIAMASKYFLTWRGGLILNPAAVGVFIAGLSGQLPAIWWIATPWMLIFTVTVALFILYRQQSFQMFAVFFAAAFAVLLVVNGMTQKDSVWKVLELAIVSWPLIFLGSVMLTEPNTVPSPRYLQLFYGLIVGALTTAQLQYGPIETSPHLALLIGNLFIAFILPPFAARLKLIERNDLADGISEFVFHKPQRLVFEAGQYMDWTLGNVRTDYRGNRRRFSLASAPSEKELRFTTRFDDRQSSFKQALDDMDIDDQINASNVRGEFILPKPGKKLLFIAGGIGITPFRSMLMELVHHKQERDIVLVYASSTNRFIYKDVLQKAKKIGVKTLLTDKRLTGPELLALVPDLLERQAYISGSDTMVDSYSDSLRRQGVKGRAIHTDHFSGY